MFSFISRRQPMIFRHLYPGINGEHLMTQQTLKHIPWRLQVKDASSKQSFYPNQQFPRFKSQQTFKRLLKVLNQQSGHNFLILLALKTNMYL